MCGIAGIISQSPLSQPDIAVVSKINDALFHRGPDGTGEFYDRHAAFAVRRLSIIDLVGGHQPLYNEDGSLVLVANGEIYNFVELRAELQRNGHLFRTGSDCETILHLYEEYGTDCVRHLRGMFAFALWDRIRRRVLFGRDRMGEKPLYLYYRKGQIVFASELKALLRTGVVPFKLSPSAVDMFFHYQYVPEPQTPILGVCKLPAAHILTADVDHWELSETCYWNMEEAPPLQGDPVELIRSELERVGEIIVRSDVPVGVALSGGLDSSGIAALASCKYPDRMHAFSVGYSGCPPNDERADAKALALHLGMTFHDVELRTEDMVDFFPRLTYWRDDPIADISGYGYYAVMQLAREHNVPVMLQGQGGDELFWGYPWVKRAVDESLRKSVLAQRGRSTLSDYLELNAPERWSRAGLWNWATTLAGLRTGWNSFSRDQTNPPEQMVFYDLTPDFRMACEEVKTLYTSGFVDRVDGSRPSGLFTFPLPWPALDVRMTRLICETYLLENGIVQGDRLSMASSVELRLPLVDYKLVETVIGLRRANSDCRLPPKAWFKRALEPVLPDWVMNRPKRGFIPPVRRWHEALFARYGNQLDGGYLVTAGVLKPESGRQLAAGPFSRKAIVPLSFKALVLELWCRQFATGFNSQ